MSAHSSYARYIPHMKNLGLQVNWANSAGSVILAQKQKLFKELHPNALCPTVFKLDDICHDGKTLQEITDNLNVISESYDILKDGALRHALEHRLAETLWSGAGAVGIDAMIILEKGGYTFE